MIDGLTAVNDSPVIVNETVNFAASITGGGYAAYSWDFGDGGTGTGATATHCPGMAKLRQVRPPSTLEKS